MHARVTYVSIRPGRMNEVKRIYRDTVVPAAETQDGFLGAMLLFLMTFAINTVAELLRQHLRTKYRTV